ncbi:MAG TPA: Ada metal-binding domain-containing protein, partial [Desulfobaccales bacterium]|nr:Ada metal-binding domain-containing protein [Desulfobaccales bacterium]
EARALPSPPAGPAEAVSPPPKAEAEAEAEFVGFKKSNKYHYPTCKWARTRYPSQLMRFKSPEEANERGYIPCPVCKPPPLSR